MKVKMLKDCQGSENGIQIKDFAKDEVYEITDGLGSAFIASGRAEEVRAEKPAVTEDLKSETEDPSGKGKKK